MWEADSWLYNEGMIQTTDWLIKGNIEGNTNEFDVIISFITVVPSDSSFYKTWSYVWREGRLNAHNVVFQDQSKIRRKPKSNLT